jgi:hypothetical protein
MAKPVSVRLVSSPATGIRTPQSAVALEASRRTPRRPARFGVRREGATRPRVGPPRRFFTGRQTLALEWTFPPSALRVLRVLRVSISPILHRNLPHPLGSLRDAFELLEWVQRGWQTFFVVRFRQRRGLTNGDDDPPGHS